MARIPRSWTQRTGQLREELAAVAEPDLVWWLFAGGVAAAEPWGERTQYVRSNAEPGADTFMGVATPVPSDPIADAIARAHAARTALRELDGMLPNQPLAVAIQRATNGHRNGASPPGVSMLVPTPLDHAAFVIGDECVVARIDDPELAPKLAAVAGGARPPPRSGTPFVCVALGEEPVETVRHGHRRAWIDGGGPWLGLGRAGGMSTVSTCHLVVDGYGHARITSRIAELGRDPLRATPLAGVRHPPVAWSELAPLARVPGGVPLAVAWRELPQAPPHVLRLAYAIGRVLHRLAGRRDARFSPTFHIPIAPGDRRDPVRTRRRVLPGIVSVRFDGGVPEPFAEFEARARATLEREARGEGLASRLLAAARGVPVPLAWKRSSIAAATRPKWLERFSEVLGGRAVVSKIRLDAPLPPTCAVSSPSHLVSPTDALGGCVVTVVDDGTHSAITACGSGIAGTTAKANELLDELLHLVGAQ